MMFNITKLSFITKFKTPVLNYLQDFKKIFR